MNHTRRQLAARSLAGTLILLTAACDWNGFGFDAAHTRSTPDPGPEMAEPQLLNPTWTGVTGATVGSSPVTADGTVFVATENGTLDAFAAMVGAETGGCAWLMICAPKWSASIGPSSSSTPAVANGLVYAGSDDGTVRAFDAAGQSRCSGAPLTCQALWRTVAAGPIVSSPQIAGSTLYVGSMDAHLYAYDARGVTNCVDGVCSPLWRAPMGGPVRSSPAVADDVVVVGAENGRLAAFDAAGRRSCSSGVCDPLWIASTPAPIRSSPAIASGIVYIGSDDGRLSAYDVTGATNCAASTCAPLWTASTGGAVRTAPAVSGGQVVIGSDDGTLRAFDAAGRAGCAGEPRTCQAVWHASMGGAVRGSPAVAGNVVYATSTSGAVAAFDLAGARNCSGAPVVCMPLWSARLPASVSAPTISRSQLFVGADALHVYRVVTDPASPGLEGATLTSERADVYGIAMTSATDVTTRAASGNVGGNTRLTFARAGAATATDLESCGTWASDAGRWNQEGAALRVHAVPGGVKAITVTKNVYFEANWYFNVHVWDTSRAPVATQIAGFELDAAFNPNDEQVPLPLTLCARVVGSTVSFVVWPSSSPRPAWGDPDHGGSVTLPAGYADAGTAGWYVGHLHPGDQAMFSELSAGPLAAGSAERSRGSDPRPPTAIPGAP